MPDMSTTQVKAPKEVIDALINNDPSSDLFDRVDFNMIFQTPDDIYQGHLTHTDEEKARYGNRTWRDWNTENWGTKWNAINSFRRSATSVYFDTAWNTPMPILLELSKRFPEHQIHVRVVASLSSFDKQSFFLLDGEKTLDPNGPRFMDDPKKATRWAYNVEKRKYA